MSPRSSKRKRDESFGIDPLSGTRIPPIRNNITSPMSSSAASSRPVSSVFELFQRKSPGEASDFSSPKLKESSTPVLSQIQTTHTSPARPTALRGDKRTTVVSHDHQRNPERFTARDIPTSNGNVQSNTEVGTKSVQDHDDVMLDEQGLEEVDYIMDDVDEDINASDASGDEIDTDNTDLSSTATIAGALMADEGRPYNVWRGKWFI